MNIKLARIHNRNMLMRIAQQAAPVADDGTETDTAGGKDNGATAPSGTPAPAQTNNTGTTPLQNKALADGYDTFIQRQQLNQFKQEPWLINLYYAYQPQPSTRLENDLGGAVRRATGTSSDRIREHLANALSRLESPKVVSLRDKAINEYARWNEQVTSEKSRMQGQADAAKSQDAAKAHDALLEWQEGTDDPSWLFLTNEVSKSALKQAQMQIVREIEREGSGILNSNPLSFSAVAADPISYFNTLMEQGYVRNIQSKGIALPFDVIMGWAESLNEAQRMTPQFQRFQGLVDQASERQGVQTDIRGIRNQGMIDRARAAEQRRMRPGRPR